MPKSVISTSYALLGTYVYSHDFYLVVIFILVASLSGCFLSTNINTLKNFFIRFIGSSLAGIVFLLVMYKEKGEEFAIYATIVSFVLALSPDIIKRIIERKL